MILVTNNLLRIAYNNKEWYTLAYIANGIAADYLEGEIDSAKEQFNELFNKLPIEAIEILRDTSVFDTITDICNKHIDSLVASQETNDHLEVT